MFILLSIADGGSHGSCYFYERFVCCNFGGNGTPPRNWYCPTSHSIVVEIDSSILAGRKFKIEIDSSILAGRNSK
jgi:hypothetical protein